MIIFGHDKFYENKKPVSNVFKPDFKKNIPAVTQGIFGTKLIKKIKDSDLFNNAEKRKVVDRHYNHMFSELVKAQNWSIYDVDQYLYPIYVNNSHFWEEPEARYPNFNEKVLDDLRKGKAKILIVYLLEAMPNHEYRNYRCLFNTWVANNQLPKESIIVISGSHDYKDFVERDVAINHITYNYWETTLVRFIKEDEHQELLRKIKEKESRKKRFLCYNRRHKPNRTLMVSELKNNDLLKHGFVSYGPILSKDEKDNLLRLTSDDKELLDMLPMTFDDRDLELNFADNFEIKDHLESYFQIVTESFWYDRKNTFFSEKIYKPIAGMQPFFLVSTPESLSQLRKNGYKTFSEWFDESYDESYSLRERVSKIVKETERLCNLPEEKLQKMLIEMLPILEHNFETLIKNDKKNKEKLIEDLEKLWK